MDIKSMMNQRFSPKFGNKIAFDVNQHLKDARGVAMKMMKGPGTVQRSMNAFLKSGFGKYVLGSGKNSFMVAAGWAVAATAFGIGRQLTRNINFNRVQPQGGVGYGQGYITWGKTSGMPSNNLSTDGLSLSLSNLRHTSYI
jgi:hypothetical protein